MSDTTKLFSKDPKTLGKKITLTVVGDVEFSTDDNSIEVPTEKVELFLSRDCGIKFSTESKETEEKRVTSETLELKKQAEDKRAAEDKKNREMLDALEEGELKSLLATYPVNETEFLTTKENIVNYLAKQMLS